MNNIEKAMEELEEVREDIEGGEGQVLSPMLQNILAHITRATRLLTLANADLSTLSDLTSLTEPMEG